MGNWKVIPVNGVTPADLIVSEGDGQTLITNVDVTNPLFLSDDAGMYAGQQNSIQLNPQSTIVVDGNSNVYALANPGHTLNVNIVPGGMSFFQSTILGLDFLVTNAGFFFYSGNPAFGNLIADIVSPATTHDPFGNPAVPIFFAGDVNNAFTQIDAAGDLIIHAGGNPVISISTTKLAMFFYTAAGIGLGNLVYSISLTGSGTDSAGNAYLPGATAYKKITSTDFQAYQANSGGWNLWTASAAGGPWNLVFTTGLQVDEVGYSMASNVNSGSITIGETAAALQVFGAEQIIASLSGGTPLTVTNNSSSAAGVIVLNAAAVGNQFMLCQLVSDTHARLRIDDHNGGRILFGPGNITPDASILYGGTGSLTADDISWQVSAGVQENWNGVSTFSNSWGNAANGPAMQYKRTAAPDNTVELIGRLLAPAGIAANQTVFTLPTNYRPNTLQGFIGVNVDTGAIVRFSVTGGTGTVQYQSGAVAGNRIDIPAGTLLSLLA